VVEMKCTSLCPCWSKREHEGYAPTIHCHAREGKIVGKLYGGQNTLAAEFDCIGEFDVVLRETQKALTSLSLFFYRLTDTYFTQKGKEEIPDAEGVD